VFLIACSTAIAVAIAAITGMLLAALAFSSGTSIGIPFVATFDGLRESGGSPTVTITGSWTAIGVGSMLLALPLWIVALRMRTEPGDR
jgi:hypothetical protein